MSRAVEMCRLCGKPATGLATIAQERYCHGDEDPSPTCYERGQWLMFRGGHYPRCSRVLSQGDIGPRLACDCR